MKTVIGIVAPLVAVLAAGCAATVAAPVQRLADAESAQRSAQELGAANQPDAQLHLRLATEQIALAKQAMDNGDSKRAEFLLVRAKADAELSIALTREQSAVADAQRATDQLNTIRSMNANQGAQP